MLSNWGMHSTTAGSAREALEILDARSTSESPVQLVISDVSMPHMDGFQLAQRIRSRETYRDLSLIMLTPSGRPGDVDRRKVLNIAGNLLKPVGESELFNMVVTVLGRRTPPGG